MLSPAQKNLSNPSICLTDNQRGKKIYFTVWPQKTLAKLVVSHSTADEVLYIYQNPPQSMDCARQEKKRAQPKLAKVVSDDINKLPIGAISVIYR